MAKTKITQVMMDDSTLNVNKEVDMVFSIANTLRGPYKADKYKDIIIPMIIITPGVCSRHKGRKWENSQAEGNRGFQEESPNTPAGAGASCRIPVL